MSTLLLIGLILLPIGIVLELITGLLYREARRIFNFTIREIMKLKKTWVHGLHWRIIAAILIFSGIFLVLIYILDATDADLAVIILRLTIISFLSAAGTNRIINAINLIIKKLSD